MPEEKLTLFTVYGVYRYFAGQPVRHGYRGHKVGHTQKI